MSDKQPIGFAVDGWTPRPFPPRTSMTGRLCRVEPLDIERHTTQLHEANLDDADGRNWTYLHSEPSGDLPAYRGWLEKMTAANDPFFHAIIDNRTGEAVGVAAYLVALRRVGDADIRAGRPPGAGPSLLTNPSIRSGAVKQNRRGAVRGSLMQNREP